MLIIYNKDASVSRIQVAPEFFHSVKLGRTVITYREKAESVAHSVTMSLIGKSMYSGHALIKGEEVLIKVGSITDKPSPPTKDWNRILVKDARRNFKKMIEDKYGFERTHGYSLNQIWNKYAQKGVLASSTTQLI